MSRSAAETVDPVSILTQLGVSEPTRIRAVTGGWDTRLFRVEMGANSYALRVFQPGQRHVWEREQLAMGTAAAARLPVPRVAGQTIWHDLPVLLLSWIPGDTIKQRVVERPWRAIALGRTMGRVHAAIHAIPAPAALGDGALLHMDYHPLNVMADAHRVTGVLDWANATAGDPRADLARTTVVLRLSHLPDAGQLLTLLGRRGIELGWRLGYADVRGWPGGMAPFYAHAGAWMEADLRPKLGRPGIPLTEADLSRVQRWTAHWRKRARR
ncbi:MAG: phosphotransferase [Chloroflexi bacterium]|nr:phosphotransferase [Chloroflexota bacterium]